MRVTRKSRFEQTQKNIYSNGTVFFAKNPKNENEKMGSYVCMHWCWFFLSLPFSMRPSSAPSTRCVCPWLRKTHADDAQPVAWNCASKEEWLVTFWVSLMCFFRHIFLFIYYVSTYKCADMFNLSYVCSCHVDRGLLVRTVEVISCEVHVLCAFIIKALKCTFPFHLFLVLNSFSHAVHTLFRLSRPTVHYTTSLETNVGILLWQRQYTVYQRQSL